jgi:hypothetical protein
MASKATDLLELVDWKATECLNESPEHTLQNVLKQVRMPHLERCTATW